MDTHTSHGIFSNSLKITQVSKIFLKFIDLLNLPPPFPTNSSETPNNNLYYKIHPRTVQMDFAAVTIRVFQPNIGYILYSVPIFF